MRLLTGLGGSFEQIMKALEGRKQQNEAYLKD